MNAFFTGLDERRATWLDAGGPGAEIAVSTRVRLARNLKAFPFPHAATDVELQTVKGDLGRRIGRQDAFASGWSLDLASLDAVERRVLLEMLLASPEMVAKPEHRLLLVDRTLSRAILINEEDHLRLLSYRSGFDPFGALEDVLELDGSLEGEYDPAFAEDLGYLTSSPTNVGTGLRLSALLHLPGLVLADEIDKVLNALRQLQFSVRGLAGRGHAVRGALFRISNLITLGRDEHETAEDFGVHVGKIIGYERAARELLRDRDALGLEDMAQRSLATLRHARLISSQETYDCLSQVRMAMSLELLPRLSLALLNRMLVVSQSGHLDLAAGRRLAGREQTAARAELLRSEFAA